MWTTVIKHTGFGGVVGFLIHQLLISVYSAEIINLFGRERIFTITIILIVMLYGLAVMFIMRSKENRTQTNMHSEETRINEVNYNDKAVHIGDNSFNDK